MVRGRPQPHPRSATSYLSRPPRALLLVVGARQAYAVRLRATRIEEAGDGRIAVAFGITAVDSDTRDVALTPMLARVRS